MTKRKRSNPLKKRGFKRGGSKEKRFFIKIPQKKQRVQNKKSLKKGSSKKESSKKKSLKKKGFKKKRVQNKGFKKTKGSNETPKKRV
ncbi:hypothetical protein HpDR72_00010 [Helicobacter pylori]